MMKKSVIIILSLSTLLTATEFQYGDGTFSMKGGFVGLTDTIDTDINSYTLTDRHSNIGNFFYGYDFTWYDSDTLRQNQDSYNGISSDLNNLFQNGSSLPTLEHRFKGLDANLRVGYDILHKNQDNFLGLGLLLGISIPTIDSASSDSDSDSSDVMGLIEDSETEISTYKIGATINFQKAFTKQLSIYGIGSYAYQTGNIKNDYADSDYSVDGTFQEYNLGLYFSPFTEKYQWGWLTLSPRIYATLGYKYVKWDVDDVAINLTGQEMSSEVLDPFATKFTMDTSIGYFGLGYSF